MIHGVHLYIIISLCKNHFQFGWDFCSTAGCFPEYPSVLVILHNFHISIFLRPEYNKTIPVSVTFFFLTNCH